jgi:hypothetical protein
MAGVMLLKTKRWFFSYKYNLQSCAISPEVTKKKSDHSFAMNTFFFLDFIGAKNRLSAERLDEQYYGKKQGMVISDVASQLVPMSANVSSVNSLSLSNPVITAKVF